MKFFVAFCRIILGATFIFSGFVKSVDPYGTAYKITEYMGVFGMNSFVETIPWLPIFVSVALCSFEFILGIILISHIYKKSTNWFAAIAMIFFTVLTLIDALTNKVSDCGCFGDAIKLTNWETFWKNVILDILLIIVIVFDKIKSKSTLGRHYSMFYTCVVVILVVSFTIFNAVYEPLIDFRAWKEGNRMVPKKEDIKPAVSFAEYKNNQTGKKKEFGMDELMTAYEQDPNFASNWTFVNSRVINYNTINADGFSMLDVSNKDNAFEFLTHQGVSFIFAIVDMNALSKIAIEKVSEFQQDVQKAGVNNAIITATSPTQWDAFLKKGEWSDVMIYSCDDKAIKTMIRSNPGVVIINNGVVIKKFSWRCLPSFDKLQMDKLVSKYSNK